MSGWRLIILLSVCLIGETGAAIRSVEVNTPRSFGYMIGDAFNHRIQIALDDPWKLDTDSLPENGRVGIWFERRIIRFNERRISKGTQYQLELGYQIFNAAKEPVEVFTPQLEMRVVDSEKQIPIFIQEWGVTVVPVTRDDVYQSLDYLELQPPARPPPHKSVPTYALLAVAGVGVLFSLTILGYVFGCLPGVRRTQGPFARTLRRLKALRKTSADPEVYQQALRYVHQAFNETAGHVVLGDDLDRFFHEQPRHASLREPIARLFNRSRREFFEPSERSLAGDFSDLLKLCRQCRDVERGLC